MLGHDQSVHRVTWASAGAADALLIENRVSMPAQSAVPSPSQSEISVLKCGSNKVAAGTESIVHSSANAVLPEKDSRPTTPSEHNVFLMV